MRVTAADTRYTPYDSGTYASSQIFVAGNATLRAARDLKENFQRRLARHFPVEPEKIRFAGGRVFIPGKRGKPICLFRKRRPR